MNPQVHYCTEFQGYTFMGLWCKGYLSSLEFAEAVTGSFGTDFNIDAEKIEHRYQRSIPAGPDLPGHTIIYPSKPGRGAYKVTWLDAKFVKRNEAIAS